jgi:hypothetical protein
MRVQRVVMPDGSGSWTVLDDRGEVIGPAEAFLAHLQALNRSPETVRTYAISPPRERPRASRFVPAARGFLSFGSAPCFRICRDRASGAGRVLVGPHHRRVGAHGPVRSLALVAPGAEPAQDLLPGPVQRPPAMPAVHDLPVPVAARQVPPRAAGPRPEQDPVDHGAVIIPPVTLPRVRGHQRRQPLPFLIGQVMPIQQIIHPRPSTRGGLQDL